MTAPTTSASNNNAKDQQLIVRAYYLLPKSNGDYFVFPKYYNFVTTQAFIDSLNHNHFISLKTQLPNEPIKPVHAHIIHIRKPDSNRENSFKELHAEPIHPSKKELRAWYNYLNILKKKKNASVHPSKPAKES